MDGKAELMRFVARNIRAISPLKAISSSSGIMPVSGPRIDS